MSPVSHQSPLIMAFADRLKPLCSQRPSSAPSSPSTPSSPSSDSSTEVSAHRWRRSPSQRRAREIVRKYRRHVRNAEFRRLRSVVPAVADDEKASQADILEETIRYIDALHQKLLARVHTDGLPARLTHQAASGAPTTASSAGTNGSSSGRSTTAAATAVAVAAGPQPQMTAAELKALIDGKLRPQLEKSVRQKRFEDDLRLQQIMMTAGVAASEGSTLS